VAPFSCDLVAACDDLPVNDETTTDTGPKDNAKYDPGLSSGTVDCLRECKAIRVVFKPDRPS